MGRTLLVGLVAAGVLVACGGSDDSATAPAPEPTEWVKIDSVTTQATSARLSGTAWVSKSWAGYRCVGLFCSNTDDFPGVRVTWFNQSTGTSGEASSTYGGGTRYVHLWSATIALASGTNAVVIHANDPSGRGASAPIEIVAGAGN